MLKQNICHEKKCVACQRKSSLCDRVRTFFVQKREEISGSDAYGGGRNRNSINDSGNCNYGDLPINEDKIMTALKKCGFHAP